MCKKYETFSLLEEYKNGVLYKNGNKIDLNEYFKGNIVIIEQKTENADFFDLTEFDKLF